MNKIYFILLSFLTISSVFGQDLYFAPGKILSTNGDTLVGLINLLKNAKQIQYKTSTTKPIVNYSTTQITGYIDNNNKIFLSKIVATEDKTVTIDTVFAHLIVKGTISFYKYSNGYTEIFFVEKDGKCQELRGGTLDFTAPDGQIKRRENRHYIGVLSFLTQECLSTQELLKTVNYQKESIANLLHNYNNLCTSQSSFWYKEDKNKKKTIPLKKGFKVGYGLYNSISVGVLLKHFVTTGTAIQFELAYNNFKISDNKSSVFSAYSLKQVADVTISNISLNFRLRHYNSLVGKFKPFIGYGLSIDRVSTTVNTTNNYFALDGTPSFKETASSTFNTFGVGGIIDLGIIWNMSQKQEINFSVSPQYHYIYEFNREFVVMGEIAYLF
jgi:hypothetical protein